MKKAFTVMAVLLLVAAVAVPSFAYRGWRGHGDGPCGDITNVPGLNLSADQKTKLTDMRKAHLKEIKPLQDKMFIRQGDLRLLWQEKNLDQAKITALDKEIRALRDQIHDKRTSYQWAVYKLLTPEQREKLGNFGPGGYCLGQGMGHKRGPGYGPGPGMMGPGGRQWTEPAPNSSLPQ